MVYKPAPKQTGGLKSDVKKGFLNSNSGALYPEGSNEAAPALWRGKGSEPVLKTLTSPEQYEVVGNFKAAGDYVGKEDFDISHTGPTLRVRGKTAEEDMTQSLVAGIDETVELPIDADWDKISAEYRNCELHIVIPRIPPEEVPARVLPPSLLRKLEGLTVEQAKVLLPEDIGPEELLKRLEALPDPPGQPSDQPPAPVPAPPPAEEEIEEIETPSVAADHARG